MAETNETIQQQASINKEEDGREVIQQTTWLADYTIKETITVEKVSE